MPEQYTTVTTVLLNLTVILPIQLNLVIVVV